MVSVLLKKIIKSYDSGPRVLDEIDLDVAAGELFFLPGPSGCGASRLPHVYPVSSHYAAAHSPRCFCRRHHRFHLEFHRAWHAAYAGVLPGDGSPGIQWRDTARIKSATVHSGFYFPGDIGRALHCQPLPVRPGQCDDDGEGDRDVSGAPFDGLAWFAAAGRVSCRHLCRGITVCRRHSSFRDPRLV